ncbi:MAG: tyrosine-type recombinase/integrase [Thermacetogeniaceae bacterium]
MAKIARLTARNVNLCHALSEFLLFKQAGGTSERTLKDYGYHLNAFLKAYPKLKSYDDVRNAVLAYLSKPCSPAYRNIKLRYLRSFFNWCVSQGYLPANPLAGVRQAKEDLNRIRHASLEDVKKLLEQPDKNTYTGLRDYCLILVQLDTGVRPGELLQAKVSDLTLETRELYIRPEVAKTRVGRTLVLSPFTCQWLAKLISIRPKWWSDDVPIFASENGKPLDTDTFGHRLRKYCQKAGVKVTPYGLRHTFALEFLKESNDPFALQRILGHQDLTMTRRYVRYLQEDVREIHEKASPVQKLLSMGKKAPRKVHGEK